MERPFSEAMLKSIESQIEQCHEKIGFLDVDKAAERARRENLPDNMAPEDIVDHFVSHVGKRCTIEFLPESLKAIVRSELRAIPLKRLPLTNGNCH
jgi:hypothetical protein